MTIKAAEIWNPNAQYLGGSHAVLLPGRGNREAIDRLTGEWETYDGGRQIRAIEIVLPIDWKLIETMTGEGALLTGTHDVILNREIEVTGSDDLTAITECDGRLRHQHMIFKAWEG